MNNKQSPGSLKQSSSDNRTFLLRYLSLGTQLLAAIGLAVFAGYKADGWMHTMPLFTCALPLLTLVIIFYKIYTETKRNKNT